MKLIKKRVVVSILIMSILIMMVASVCAEIVTVDARINNLGNPIIRFYGPGTYDVIPIGIADGGLYDAWSAHYSTANSWKSGYALSGPGFQIAVPDGAMGPYYSTPLLALEAALSSQFILEQAGEVHFYIPDGPGGIGWSYDNTYGMSLLIIPEPASIGLLTLGYLVITRRRYSLRTI